MWGNGIGMGRGQKGGMGLSMIKIFNFFVCVFNPFGTFFSVKKIFFLWKGGTSALPHYSENSTKMIICLVRLFCGSDFLITCHTCPWQISQISALVNSCIQGLKILETRLKSKVFSRCFQSNLFLIWILILCI